MVLVTVTASVAVAGGPTLSVGAPLEPQSYTYATVTLDAAGGPHPSHVVALLPDGGTVVLLAVSATTAKGAVADVRLKPSHGSTDGTELTVEGTLLLANPGVLAALVSGGPRTLTLTNPGTEAVTVKILTGLDAP